MFNTVLLHLVLVTSPFYIIPLIRHTVSTICKLNEVRKAVVQTEQMSGKQIGFFKSVFETCVILSSSVRVMIND